MKPVTFLPVGWIRDIGFPGILFHVLGKIFLHIGIPSRDPFRPKVRRAIQG
jgi:hypothetical protein